MQTFIISSKNIDKARDRAIDKIQTEKISKFDVEILEFEKPLGIEDVRQVQKNIFLTPFQGEKKATVIVMKNSATVDAQNSMLKLLEEPPPSSLIFLVTDNHLSFLPTVLSRVKLIEIANEENQTNNDAFEKIQSLNGVGDSLYLAQVVAKEKTDAIIFLEGAILAAREKMLANLENKQESLKLRKMIHNMELTHYTLKSTNANSRLALENLFLNLN